MNKFENVDIFASLDAIMRQNTGFFQSDFDIDKEIIEMCIRDRPAAYRRMGKQSDADCQRQGRPRRIYGGYRGYGAGTGKDLSVSF